MGDTTQSNTCYCRGTKCDACSRVIPLRLGKQAYVCRDCGATTHKQCHTKVDIVHTLYSNIFYL